MVINFNNDCGTYNKDLKLFSKLGLKPFKIPADNGELFVGEVNMGENSKVKIYVSCCPAQFYRFEITDTVGNYVELSTGSGSLTSFWGTVTLFAENMLVCKKAKVAKRDKEKT